ncbi:MAG: SDR family NAD(P)-dependent oxidoreductase [Ilumatobacteraceae bacterium]|jgi:NAD(P)-dependent dehydrogenase (short-subunit alcohol dehydrogenase family)|nr:SDR family NAD(P)-dependent oxidoreductase [Actinomycetota bacterium]MDA3011522.1 SDR family NAD(P)-dependent oxidoreductase [Actinomycetota bacterium]MDA3024174.1 SDR family NAD(P)-dependent oxidoreductase [Actinomycetota bacterium]NBU54889.1 SDR family oxidoreductase [Acidimicrobiia bacterium]
MIEDHSSRPLVELWNLTGRRAVITGGAVGIGAQIARRLAEAGASVLLADIDQAAAAAMAADIAATGGQALSSPVDISDTTSIVDLVELAMSTWGGIDIWVNNAGIYPTTGPALDAEDDFIDRMMDVNVRGTFACSREAARRMRGGVIVNLASTTGFRAAPGISAYSISKHAVVGLTRALALEFAPLDIRVVAVAPGPIDTPGVRTQMTPLKEAGLDVEAVMARNPLGRRGVPDDIARVVCFLASDMAAWITGEVVVADAGSLAG